MRCWYAPRDLKIGDKFRERIEESIQVYDKLLVVLSKNSVSSRWVEREVTAALQREDDQNKVILFPIRLDDTTMNSGKPWASEIRRERHIGDFRKWKSPDTYRQVLDRLLHDLKT